MRPLQRLFQAIGLLALAVVALAVIFAVHGYGLVRGRESRPLLPLRVLPDPGLASRGRHLADVTCVGCHSPNDSLPLSGGRVNFLRQRGSPTLGVLYAPNLTPGGSLKDYPDPELARAIREGLDRQRGPMLVMPSGNYRGLSDRDLAAIIAYLRAQPAVPGASPARRLSPLAYLLLGMQAYETSLQRPVTKPVPRVREAATPGYGEYLTGLLGCGDCHGTDFRGGRSPLAPRGPDLLPVVGRYPRTAFRRAMKQGIGTSGRTLDPVAMPWPVLSRLSDLEVAAVYENLRRQTGAVRPGS